MWECVRHRIDGLEKAKTMQQEDNQVRHRIDGLENLLPVVGCVLDVRHRIDGLEIFHGKRR